MPGHTRLNLFNRFFCAILSILLVACGGGGGSSADDSDASSSSVSDSNADDSSDTSTDTSSDTGSSTTTTDSVDVITTEVSLGDCEATDDTQTVVCAADNWLATLSSDELAQAQLEWSDASARTAWSNLPVGNTGRNGLGLFEMDEASKEAALVLAKSVLSDSGYEDMIATFAADQYLQDIGGNGYDKEYYYFAVFGYPGSANDWMLQIGGHHLAYNITFLSGSGYPTPHHIGAEPKVSFEVNSHEYSVLEDEAEAFVAMFDGLSASQLAYAFLSGQSFSDVLMGPDNGSGELPDDYPSTQEGILVADLTAEQQALVTQAIATYVEDYNDSISAPLMEAYTSDTAYAQTYIAWAGTEAAGIDMDVNGTYLRIDGPRLWLEIVCQGGVIIRNETHYHTIFRDKTMDYGNAL